MANSQIAGLTARTLALTDVFPTQDAAASGSAGKNTMQDVMDLISVARTIKVSISSVELLAAFTTPKVIVAAQGASTMIVPLRIVTIKNFVTTPYATNINIIFGLGTVFASTFSNALGFSASEIAINTLTTNASASPASGSINTDLTLSVATGNPTAGDGTIDIYLTYVIMPV